MMRTTSTKMLTLSSVALLSVAACGGSQSVKNGTPSGQGTVNVVYNATSTTVTLSTLTTVAVSGNNYDRLSDIVLAAVTGKMINQLEATNFVGSDGYTPTSKAGSQDYVPTPGTTLATLGFIDPATNNLIWDASLSFPNYMTVRGEAEIDVADVPSNGNLVRVVYNGIATNVDLTAVLPGGGNIALRDIITAGVAGKTINQLKVTDFIAFDGFTPTSKSSSSAYFPVTATTLSTQGDIDPSTDSLVWDSALSYPNYMKVSGLVEIVVTDA